MNQAQREGEVMNLQSTLEVYCVERSLPGLTRRQLADVHWALLQTVERIAKNGGQIRYVRSTFLPDQSRCICIFESSSRELVRTVNETAQIPFTRIENALDFNFLGG